MWAAGVETLAVAKRRSRSACSSLPLNSVYTTANTLPSYGSSHLGRRSTEGKKIGSRRHVTVLLHMGLYQPVRRGARQGKERPRGLAPRPRRRKAGQTPDKGRIEGRARKRPRQVTVGGWGPRPGSHEGRSVPWLAGLVPPAARVRKNLSGRAPHRNLCTAVIPSPGPGQHQARELHEGDIPSATSTRRGLRPRRVLTGTGPPGTLAGTDFWKTKEQELPRQDTRVKTKTRTPLI